MNLQHDKYPTQSFSAIYFFFSGYPPHQATVTKKFVSPSPGTTIVLFTIPSPTASLNFSAVAGLSNTNPSTPAFPSNPFPALAALTASLSAKNTVAPRKSGGSPIPLLLCTLLRCFHVSFLPSPSTLNIAALKICGMSLNPGIL